MDASRRSQFMAKQPVTKARRGFAAMNSTTQKKIARAGGLSSARNQSRDKFGQFSGRTKRPKKG